MFAGLDPSSKSVTTRFVESVNTLMLITDGFSAAPNSAKKLGKKTNKRGSGGTTVSTVYMRTELTDSETEKTVRRGLWCITVPIRIAKRNPTYALGNNFGLGFARLNSPAGRLVVATDRTWTDANGDYVPDCDLKTPLASGECGPMANQDFGTSRGATLYADELKRGWGVSPYLWQIQAAVQRELLANVALNAGYYRTWQGNISLTDNLAVTAADFTPYCITAPADRRLPGGGGYPVCGLYDVSPARFGQIQNLVTFASDRSNVFDGFDASLSARFGNGGMLRAGFSPSDRV